MYNELMYALIVDAEAEFLKDVVHPEIVKQLDKMEKKYGSLDNFCVTLRKEMGAENITICEEIYGMPLEQIIPFLKTHPVKLVGGEVRPMTAECTAMEARILASKGITVITPKKYSDSATIYMYSLLTHILGASGATHITCSHSSNNTEGRKALAPDGSQLLADMYEHYRTILMRNITKMMQEGYEITLAGTNDPNILKVLDYDKMVKLYKSICTLTPDDIEIINAATENGHKIVLNCLNGSTWKTLKPLLIELGINPEVFDLVLSEEDRFFNAGFIPTRSLELMGNGRAWLTNNSAKIGVNEKDWRAIKLKIKDAGIPENRFIINNELKDADYLIVEKEDGQHHIVKRGSDESLAQLTNWVYSVDHLGIDTTMDAVVRSISYRHLLAGKPAGTKVCEGDPDSDRFVEKTVFSKTPETIKLIESFGLDYYELGDNNILVAFNPNKVFLGLDIVDYELLEEKGLLDKYILLYLITYVSSEAWQEFADSPKVHMTKIMSMVGFKNLTAELQRLIEAWWFDELDDYPQDLLEVYKAKVSHDKIIFEDQLGFTVAIERVNGKEIRFHAKEEESGGRTGAIKLLWNLLGKRVLALPEKSFADALLSELRFSSKNYMETFNKVSSKMASGKPDLEAVLKEAIKGDYSILEFLNRKFEKYGLKSRIDARFDILHGDPGLISSLGYEEQQVAMERCAASKTNFNNFFFSLGNAAREGKADIAAIQEILTSVLPQYKDTWMALSQMTVTWERIAKGQKRPEGAPMYFKGKGTPLVTALKARPSATDFIKSKIYLDAIKLLLSQRKELEKAFNDLTEYDLYDVLQRYGIESILPKPVVFDELGLRKFDTKTVEGTLDKQPETLPDNVRTYVKDGFKIYSLTDPRTGSSFEVIPGKGAMISSFKVGGQEILLPTDDLKGSPKGIPFMGPTPNRVEGGMAIINGQEVDLNDIEQITRDDKGNLNHGPLRNMAWKMDKVESGKDGVIITCSIDTSGTKIGEKLGKAEYKLIYTLKGNKLTKKVKITNKDNKHIDVGFGWHDWANSQGDVNDWEIILPAGKYCENKPGTLLPTGKLKDTKELGIEPGKIVSLNGKAGAFDNVLTGLEFGKDGWAESLLYNKKDGALVKFRQNGKYLKYIVFFTHADGKSICVEAQSCMTNAHNLKAQGVDSGLVTIGLDETIEAESTIEVENIGPNLDTDAFLRKLQENKANAVFASLAEKGHVISKDFITPAMITSGQFGEQVKRGIVQNATTNPSSNAGVWDIMVNKTKEWVPLIEAMIKKGMTAQEIYDTLFIEHLVVPAMKILAPVNKKTGYLQGYVSYEFRPKFTADPDIKEGDAGFEEQVQTALDEIKRLDTLIMEKSGGLHNFFIKVPATHVGVEAGKRAIALGMNINYTLIATYGQYIECVKAYKAGVSDYVRNGQKRGKIGESPYAMSVASDFVSRTDREIDPLLASDSALKMQSGLAYAIGKVYNAFTEEFINNTEWNEFAKANNIPIQQIYWGSTGVKEGGKYTANPHYAGPLRLYGTVNTAPPDVVDAVAEEAPFDGELADPAFEERQKVLAGLKELGIDIDMIQGNVYRSGLEGFAKDDAKIFTAIEDRIKELGNEDFKGSSFKALRTMVRLEEGKHLKAGDSITAIGMVFQRNEDEKDRGGIKIRSVRNELNDLVSVGVLKRPGKKDINKRDLYTVLVSPSLLLSALPQDIKDKLSKGKIRKEDVDMIKEVVNAVVVADKLRTPLDAHGNTAMADRFRKGGAKDDGYGVPEGSAVDGSHAFEGAQGYYVEDSGNEVGKNTFLKIVDARKDFYKKREEKFGSPIRVIKKPGIGGQHTPFQGIADVFAVNNPGTIITGEYELGKDYKKDTDDLLKKLSIAWFQLTDEPSSKSGATDETMMIFVELFYTQLIYAANDKGLAGEKFADLVLNTLHEINFKDGKERPAGDLFKVDKERFGTDSLIELIYRNCKNSNLSGLNVTSEQVKGIFSNVIGNMFFETTDIPKQSRLSAFIRNSGLDKELGDDAAGFGAMNENVGGRWTGDFHIMTPLAFYGLDSEQYWNIRKSGIREVREGNHRGNILGNKIVDEGITDIAFVVPDEFFFLGKSYEQNNNESLWQEGFPNLVTIKQSHWEAQKHHYENKSNRLVLNMSDLDISGDSFNIFKINIGNFKKLNNQGLADLFADLFTTFYGTTSTIATRLIAKALLKEGYTAADVDLNDLDNPATKIVQRNLHLLQPFVELGKGFLEAELKALQEEDFKNPGAINRKFEEIKQAARDMELKTNIKELSVPDKLLGDPEKFASVIRQAAEFAKSKGRKFVPFIYLEGGKYLDLRDYLASIGYEWIMQGTGDQHISYQQVLAQPQKFLPFIISFVPEKHLPGRPAIGFAKGYLNNVSPHMVRDLFAGDSYKALEDRGGLGLFLRIIDSEDNIDMLKQAAIPASLSIKNAINKKAVRRINKDL